MESYPQVSTEKGRLYHYLHTLGGPEATHREVSVLVRWFRGVATFQEIVDEFKRSERGSYNLRLDDRTPQDFRCGKPGYFVFGNPYPSLTGMEKRVELVGVFIPEGMEEEVVEWFETSMGPTLLLPATLPELARMVPGSLSVSLP